MYEKRTEDLQIITIKEYLIRIMYILEIGNEQISDNIQIFSFEFL